MLTTAWARRIPVGRRLSPRAARLRNNILHNTAGLATLFLNNYAGSVGRVPYTVSAGNVSNLDELVTATNSLAGGVVNRAGFGGSSGRQGRTLLSQSYQILLQYLHSLEMKEVITRPSPIPTRIDATKNRADS